MEEIRLIMSNIPNDVKNYYNKRASIMFHNYLNPQQYKYDQWIDLYFSTEAFDINLGGFGSKSKESKMVKKNLGDVNIMIKWYYSFPKMNNSYILLDCTEMTEKTYNPCFKKPLRVPYIFGMNQKIKCEIIVVSEGGSSKTKGVYTSKFMLRKIIGVKHNTEFKIFSRDKKECPGVLVVSYKKSVQREHNCYDLIDYMENGYNLAFGQIFDFNKSNGSNKSVSGKHYS